MQPWSYFSFPHFDFDPYLTAKKRNSLIIRPMIVLAMSTEKSNQVETTNSVKHKLHSSHGSYT